MEKKSCKGVIHRHVHTEDGGEEEAKEDHKKARPHFAGTAVFLLSISFDICNDRGAYSVHTVEETRLAWTILVAPVVSLVDRNIKVEGFLIHGHATCSFFLEQKFRCVARLASENEHRIRKQAV